MNVRGKHGRTALVIASQYGCTKFVLDLLKSGADISLKSDWEEGAIEYAAMNNHSDIVGMLQKYGEKDFETSTST